MAKFDTARNNLKEVIKNALSAKGEEVLITGNNEFSIPIIEEGDEAFVKISFIIPKGSRDGIAYDGYEAEVEHLKVVDEKAKKKTEAEAKKAKKIAEDKKKREEKTKEE